MRLGCIYTQDGVGCRGCGGRYKGFTANVIIELILYRGKDPDTLPCGILVSQAKRLLDDNGETDNRGMGSVRDNP